MRLHSLSSNDIQSWNGLSAAKKIKELHLDDLYLFSPIDESLYTMTELTVFHMQFSGLKGKTRKWFSWAVIIFSDLAFGAVTVFSLKRLFVSEVNQQPMVNTLMLLTDIGLAAVLVALAIFLIWRLYDLFRNDGRWAEELDTETKINAETELEEQKQKIKELEAKLNEVSK